MVPLIAGRIPLVRRPKAPGLPLEQRLTELGALTALPAGASHRDQVARASAVLNYAALIASDTAMPNLAFQLCWRQYEVFAAAGYLIGDIAVMALMPVVNIARLLIREGDGEAAYDVLTRLYRAAQQRSSAEIRGRTVDLAALTGTEADHRKVCEELWMIMLIDGARALAQVGRWTEAAHAMTAHRGVGNRLLDGRQIMIMSLLERGLEQQARAVIESTVPAEPWENTIADLLRLSCWPAGPPVLQPELDRALRGALALVRPADPATAAFQARVALTAIDLAGDRSGPYTTALLDAVVDVASADAYAARDVLHHDLTCSRITREQRQVLDAVLTASGLGAGSLTEAHTKSLTRAADSGAAALTGLLRRTPPPTGPSANTGEPMNPPPPPATTSDPDAGDEVTAARMSTGSWQRHPVQRHTPGREHMTSTPYGTGPPGHREGPRSATGWRG
ncbi:hypothetical protein OG900_09530 [Streptomyces sp. NBC_00433]